jgi:uncharacterized protein (DUF302 family)
MLMQYHFTTTVNMPFEAALQTTTEALKKRGFGVLTTIDVTDTLKKKIGADFRPYHILGACNPQMAHRALLAEDKIGTMLPCNVIVQQTVDGLLLCKRLTIPHLVRSRQASERCSWR